MSRLRKAHLDLARSYRHNNKSLHKYQTAQAVLDRYIPYLTEEKGKKLVVKSSGWGRLSKMTTTYYNQIRLGSGWKKYDSIKKAYILVHEAVHVRQWAHYGRIKFGARYVFNPRWRWAVEVQGYREGIMWGVVYLHANGKTKAQIENSLERNIDSAINSLLKKYSLGTIRKSDIKKYTRRILEEAIQWQYARL